MTVTRIKSDTQVAVADFRKVLEEIQAFPTSRAELDRILKPVAACVAGPNVSNTITRQMLRPFGCDDISTTLRTLIVCSREKAAQ